MKWVLVTCVFIVVVFIMCGCGEKKSEKDTSIDRNKIYQEEQARAEARGRIALQECIRRCEEKDPIKKMYPVCEGECRDLLFR